MAIYTEIPALFAAILLFAADLRGERIMGEEMNDDFDFDGLPGAQHEFKWDVGAGGEECFYQKMAYDALLHVNFKVLRGGNTKVDVTIRDSALLVINGLYYKSEGVMEYKATAEGTYAVCIDNAVERFNSKLVYIYIMTFVVGDWNAYMKQFTEMKYLSGNLTQALANVDLSLQEMKKSQAHSRFNVVKDFYVVWGNNRYVQYWSMTQCVLIVIAAVTQVVVLRRMFRTTDVTPTAKPRA